MVSKTKTLDPRLVRRQCVACGYDGGLLRNGLAPRCARCGCDLRKRPARSYVEMEGLLSRSRRRDAPRWDLQAEARLLRRWLALLFLAVIGLVMIIYLAAATFSV